MTLPPVSPPTDSLYKFLAISGLVLIVVLLVLDSQAVNQFRGRASELRLQALIAGDEIGHAEKQLTAATQPGAGATSAPDTAGLLRRVSELKARSEALLTEQDVLEHEQKANIGWLIIGAAQSLLGFSLWYRRIQRPQDQILLMQLAKAAREAAAQPSTTTPSEART